MEQSLFEKRTLGAIFTPVFERKQGTCQGCGKIEMLTGRVHDTNEGGMVFAWTCENCKGKVIVVFQFSE